MARRGIPRGRRETRWPRPLRDKLTAPGDPGPSGVEPFRCGRCGDWFDTAAEIDAHRATVEARRAAARPRSLWQAAPRVRLDPGDLLSHAERERLAARRREASDSSVTE